MVRKLTADEFSAVWRTWRAVLLPAILVFLVSLAIMVTKVPVLSGLGGFGAVLAMVAAFASLPVLLIVRYYRTLYGAEGYLTMTLPVRGRDLYAAKTLTAFIMMLVDLLGLSVMIGLISVALDAVSGSPLLTRMRLAWNAFLTLENQAQTVLLIALFILFAFFMAITQFAFVISKGNEARFHSAGLGGPVIIYVITYMVQQFASLIGMIAIPLGVSLPGQAGAGAGAPRLVAESSLPSILASIRGEQLERFTLGIGFIIMLLAVGAAYVLLTVRSLEHHTSLR